MPSLSALASLLLSVSVASLVSGAGITGPLLHNTRAQAGPCLLQNTDGIYHIYANDGIHIQSETTGINGAWEAVSDFVVQDAQGNPFPKVFLDPSVALINGVYNVYFAANDKIYGATSTSVNGPFILPANDVVIPGAVGNDSSAPKFFQYDGQNYMLYKKGQPQAGNGQTSLCIAPLSADGLTATGSETTLYTVTPGQMVDGQNLADGEGPGMAVHDGTFYLYFTAGTYCDPDYRIVWATSPGLLTVPYTFGGTLLQTGTYQGVSIVAPGKNSFVGDSTMTFMSYNPNVNLTGECHRGNASLPPIYAQAAEIQYTNGVPGLASSF